jgi:hypothetical protein
VADFEPAKHEKAITIEEIKSDVITVDAGSGEVTFTPPKSNIGGLIHKLPLYLPDNPEPYATYLSLEDWINGFVELYAKIKNSKLDIKEKTLKYNRLRNANDAFTKSWTGNQMAKFLSKIAEQGGLNG